MDYNANKNYFKMNLKSDAVNVENVTEKIEEKKHTKMLAELNKLVYRIEYEEEDPEEENLEYENKSAYQVNMMEIKKITDMKKGDSVTISILVEYVLNSLDIENYIIELSRFKIKENEEIQDYEYEDVDEEAEMKPNDLGVEIKRLNLYKYNGKFYAIDLTDLIMKAHYIEDDIENYKNPLQIEMSELEEISPDVIIYEKVKNNGKSYSDLEVKELFSYLYHTLDKQIEIDKS